MSRYIDADALLESVKNKRLIFEESTPVEEAIAEQVSGFEEAIEEALTADVVEVVRCRDCKYYKPQTRSITWNNTTKYCCRGANVKVNEDDYCSYGERREE